MTSASQAGIGLLLFCVSAGEAEISPFYQLVWSRYQYLQKITNLSKKIHFVKMIGCNVDQRKSVFSDYVLNDVVLNFQQWYCEII